MLVPARAMQTFPDILAPPTSRPAVELDEEGVWRYVETGVPAVGAEAVTLAEVADPLIVARAGKRPEAVLFPLSAIRADARLNWVMQAGAELTHGEELRFEVPWAVWQEHADQPVEARLPEYDGEGIDRALAVAEREFRLAKQTLDVAALVRQRTVVLAGLVGRSRRRVGKTLDMSAGRVQQLNEDAEEVVREVEDFVARIAKIAGVFADGPVAHKDIQMTEKFGADELTELLSSMLALGLLRDTADGLEMSEDGRGLLNSNKPVKSGKDRERASDAAR
jgi:hypothetical protein